MAFQELHKQGERLNHVCKNGIEIKRSFTLNADELIGRLWKEGFQTWYCSASYYWSMINKEKKQIVQNAEGDIDTIQCKSYADYSKEIIRILDFLKKYDKSLFQEALNYIENEVSFVANKDTDSMLEKMRVVK